MKFRRRHVLLLQKHFIVLEVIKKGLYLGRYGAKNKSWQRTVIEK